MSTLSTTTIAPRSLTRKDFCFGTAAAVTSGIALQARRAHAAETPSESWDDQADLVVIGDGAAGCSAASWFLIQNPDASVLILEAAPEGMDGGNSRVSGNSIIFADDPESLAAYKHGLDLPARVDDEVVNVWAQYVYNGNEILNEYYGTSIEAVGGAGWSQLDGTAAIKQGPGGKNECGQTTWELLKGKAAELGAQTLFETRAVKLLSDENGTVVGVECEDGRRFGAGKGIVLACGSFEFDPELLNGYRPCGNQTAIGRGSAYNCGDGIRMAQALGADLWHMNNFTGTGYCVLGDTSGDRTHALSLSTPAVPDFIFVSDEGKRFRYEENGGARGLGKQLVGSSWYEVPTPDPAYIILGQTAYDAAPLFGAPYWAGKVGLFTPPADNDAYVESGLMVRCENVAELAAAFDLPEEVLAETLDTYNAGVEQGGDPLFHRGEEITSEGTVGTGLNARSGRESKVMTESFELTPLQFPLYIARLVPQFMFSFGGPRRGAHGEVLRADGQPIPHLYSAGECGSTQAGKYQAGAAFAEAVASGRLAADSIAALDA